MGLTQSQDCFPCKAIFAPSVERRYPDEKTVAADSGNQIFESKSVEQAVDIPVTVPPQISNETIKNVQSHDMMNNEEVYDTNQYMKEAVELH